MSHGTQPTVLLIEADLSLRRLITLGLQHRGMCVITASSLNNLPVLEARSLSLLILDVDGGVHSNWSLLTAVQAHSSLSTLPIVTLAWECPPIPVPAGLTDQPEDALSTSVTCLTKPFAEHLACYHCCWFTPGLHWLDGLFCPYSRWPLYCGYFSSLMDTRRNTK